MADNNILRGQWRQLKGEARRLWGKLTGDDLDRAAGNRDKLVGSIQERYGYAKKRAASELDRWVESVRSRTHFRKPPGRRSDS
jgi:uncharacterized protein YjbJ (UPF0337 family)